MAKRLMLMKYGSSRCVAIATAQEIELLGLSFSYSGFSRILAKLSSMDIAFTNERTKVECSKFQSIRAKRNAPLIRNKPSKYC